MSLPPGFLDELRTRVTLSSVVGKKVTWDMRKSNLAKGDFWAPCPFHQEKSASFHVDDRKGFSYCFGCHAKGDAVTFVKDSENLSFIEAVAVLAAEAGMQMPARDPRAAEKADRRTEIQQVLDEAVKFYRLQLKTAAGAAARIYLAQKRRLTEAAWDRWDIGWSPENAQAVVDHLRAKGIAEDLMTASGVVAKSDTGRLYDRFHARIIFPIRDGRGRVISLGGRSLDPNARAKYLNGPETDLFDKGRTLFNQSPAREAAGKGKPLIVAEGYMDVIALCEAGFTAAVAPLGTAVTDDQLRMLWRIADEPIMALDGDSAGIKAAQRVIDLSLPLLQAGKALRFAILPGGMDPDDLIRANGAPAMQAVLDQARPMVRLLWQRETEGRVFDSPERRAALDKTLRGHLARIADPSIRSHYADEMKRLRLDLFGTAHHRPFQPGPFRKGRFAPPGGALASTRSSLLAQAGGGHRLHGPPVHPPAAGSMTCPTHTAVSRAPGRPLVEALRRRCAAGDQRGLPDAGRVRVRGAVPHQRDHRHEDAEVPPLLREVPRGPLDGQGAVLGGDGADVVGGADPGRRARARRAGGAHRLPGRRARDAHAGGARGDRQQAEARRRGGAASTLEGAALLPALCGK